nr:hypothetical protein [uncultured Bacteroides sp.]
MKKYLYILGVVFLSLPLLLTSCNQDNESLTYESETGNYTSFRQNALNYSLNGNENEVLIPIYRENTKGTETIDLKPVKSSVLSIESMSVSFADGENMAYAKIKANLDLMEYGPTYKVGLKLADASKVSTFGIDSITVSIGRTLTWTPMTQKGLFVSEAMEGTWNVDVVKADQTTFYIAKDCYEKNFDIRFDVDKTGKVTVAAQKAWTHSSYGQVYVSGTGTYANNVITVALKHYVSAGSFGTFTEKLTIPAN